MDNIKNVLLLGATGSIGTQVLDLIKDNENYCLKAFSFGHNLDKAIEIIDKFKPELVCCLETKDLIFLEEKYPDITFVSDAIGLQYVVTYDVKNPLVINALVGTVGLMPTAVAIENGRDVLLANKETLVVGGEIIMKMAKEKNVKIVPIDSEHSALYQLLKNIDQKEIKRLLISASGGALRDYPIEQLDKVSPEEVLNHPNWQMGPKITVDCATMINKAFEVIEAHYLFDVAIDQITPFIQRESMIHAMVEFNDGTFYAQMGPADMHLAINYALEENHLNDLNNHLDIVNIKDLHFDEIEAKRYPLMKIALEAFKAGKLQCTILTAANDAAVKLFLEHKISFTQITTLVEEALNNIKYQNFNQGEISLVKIMTLSDIVYNDIYEQFS